MSEREQPGNPVPDVRSFDLCPTDDVGSVARRMARTVTDWQEVRVDEYDPLRWEDKQKRHIRRGAFCEVAFYLYFLENCDRLDWAPRLTDDVVETVNDRRFFELLPRHAEMVQTMGCPFLLADRLDELRPQARETLKRVVESRPPWARERVPHRQLDLYYVLQEFGFDTRHLDPEVIIEYSNAAHPPSVVDSTLRQVYALTHNVMFYTGFGFGGEGFPDATVPYDLSTTLTGLTLRAMADANTDVVVELLFAGIVQRQVAPEFVRFVVSWLRAVSEDFDTVPGTGTGSGLVPSSDHAEDPQARPEDLGDWDELSEEWLQHAHTAMASGLCFNVLDRDWDAVRALDRCRELDHAAHGEDLLRIGDLLRLLRNYELEEAAVLMESLAGTPAADAYDDVFGRCVSFLDRQRTHDGHVGYWTDERRVFVAGGYGDEADFEREMMRRCTDRCEAAIEAAADYLE